MNAGNRNKYSTENEIVQKEIIRQRRIAFILIILFFACSVIGHYVLKHHIGSGLSAASRHINQRARRRYNIGRDREL